VEGGTQALSLAEEKTGVIHLMLSDVIMPHMSGRELTARVLSRHPETRVLYMSGYADSAIVHHGVLDEGTWFIQKPFHSEALALKVREVLDAPLPEINGASGPHRWAGDSQVSELS
jgi:two-component system cell cycle sensor histidine kinase/response regulator CckA